jgi:hypothetical protein
VLRDLVTMVDWVVGWLPSATAVESIIAELSPALGVHSGPGTTGLCLVPVIE